MPDRNTSFLVFCVDQMQSACIAAHGHPDVRTPNIDRLVERGASFTRAYCPNPICMPSRSSIFTGLTPRGHRCLTNGMSLPYDVPTLPGALADAGYRTHAVGKLHLQPFGLGGRAEDAPQGSWESREAWDSGRIESLPEGYYGFQTSDYVGGHTDYCFGDYRRWLDERYPGMHERYLPEFGETRVETELPCWTLGVPAEAHYNTWIAERSAAFMGGIDETEPFFLWCSFPDPHFSYAACPEYRDLYDADSFTLSPTWDERIDPFPELAEHRRTWGVLPEVDEAGLRESMAQTYAMVTHIDDCIGRVLDELERLGRADDTVVVFTGDHGEYLGTHNLVYKGVWPWEELYRVPLVWCAPGGAAQGGAQTCAQGVRGDVVSLLDLAPTVLDYAGLGAETLCRPEVESVIPGRSLRGGIDGAEALERVPALVEMDLIGVAGRRVRMRTIVEDRYKLTVYSPLDRGVLIDVVDDPEERRNLWDDPSCAETKGRLLHLLVERLAATDPVDVPRSAGA